MKYITILEQENNECPNVGTITIQDVESKFKEANDYRINTRG